MAKKGSKKSEKRISTDKVRNIKKKEKTWTIKAEPGPHKKSTSVPLGFILRDLLEVAQNLREVKQILNSKSVKVDGTLRTSYRFPVGLFDVVSFNKDKKGYRLVYDFKGRLMVKEIEGKELNKKICKITNKKTGKTGITELVTNDGRIFKEKNAKYKVGDSLEIELPGQKISKSLEFAKGNTAYVSGGTHISAMGKITEIVAGTMKRKTLVTLKTADKEEFSTTENNIIVIGKEKGEIDI
ncbi:MAG: 30S ribosomal protein S4e [Candidatus Diapherotrites archaeon]